MTHRDMWATCEECERQFVFRIEDQRQQEREGKPITPPELCPDCRGSARSRAVSRPEVRRAPSQEPRPEAKPKEASALGYGPHEGKVKWYSSEKGYGFIVHPSGTEIFFHHTGIAPGESHDLPDGTQVTFLVEESERGPQAVEVERMDT